MAKEKTCGIYKITSPSGSIYIGQSVCIEKRWTDYNKAERAKYQVRLYKSFVKYGVSAHKFEILYSLPNDICTTNLTAYEQFYIDQFREAGCNLMNVRDAGNKGKISLETRKKMSIKATGRIHTPETRLHLSKIRKGTPSPRKGVKLTPEQIEKTSRANLGRKHTLEARQKISKNNARYHLGKSASAEMILKNRLARLGKRASEETKRKMSDAAKGKPKSLEHNLKVSAALKIFHEKKRINFLISTFGMLWNYKPCLSFRSAHFFPAPLLSGVHNSTRLEGL